MTQLDHERFNPDGTYRRGKRGYYSGIPQLTNINITYIISNSQEVLLKEKVTSHPSFNYETAIKIYGVSYDIANIEYEPGEGYTIYLYIWGKE